MMYKGKKVIKNCLLCKNYCKHPCECSHCDDYDNFRISKDGQKLYKEIFEQGYQCKSEENI